VRLNDPNRRQVELVRLAEIAKAAARYDGLCW
jgi:hypothetical protein